MDITKYEVLLKVVDRGGLSQSAEDLGYTRSALSKMIASMEKEIGFPLVKRTRKGIVLNEEGERVVPLIRELLKVNTILEEEYLMIRGMSQGKLRIGSFPTMAYLLVPDILKGFNEIHPGIQIEVVEEHSLHQLETWLKQGIIDVALFSRESYHEFDWIPFMEEPYVALIPKACTLAEKEVISIEEMFDHKLILFKTQEGYDQDMMKFQEITAGTKEADYNTNSIYLVQKMVAYDNCVSIIPLSVAEDTAKWFPVEFRKLNTEVKRTIGFAVKHKENVSLTLREFLRYVKKARQMYIGK